MNIQKLKTHFKKVLLGTLAGTLLFFTFAQTKAPAEWIRPIQSVVAGGNPVYLTAHPLDPEKFLIANNAELLEGSSSSKWKTLWVGSGSDGEIIKIFSFEFIPHYVFILTENRVILGNLNTSSWRVVYDGGNNINKIPLSFACDPLNPNRWFLGIRQGLRISEDAGKSWHPADLFPVSDPVLMLRFFNARLFIGTASTLYLSLSGSLARSVFELSKKTVEPTEAPEIMENDTGDQAVYLSRLYDLLSIPSQNGLMYLATEKGVLESFDGGHSWQSLSQSGLQNTATQSLAYSQKYQILFAATPSGIFEYLEKDKVWKALSDGIARSYAKSLAIINDEKLLAITGEGFMEYQIKPEISLANEIFTPSADTLRLFKKLVSSEPTSRDIQQAVIRYANVRNGKIRRWHAFSRLAGLLPTFSLGKDFSRSPSIDLDRGGTNDPDAYILGPDDVNKSWNADLSWDLGDAVYSSDQTSIDSREKLMVELRQDLLAEATRIYYERRRLQINIVYTPAPSEQDHLERLIRMDELSSLLDGMTNGFLSERLEEIYEKNPEFEKLWNSNPYGQV